MAEKEFKKVALVNVGGDYIAPVAYSAQFDKDGDVIDISSLATQVDVDNKIQVVDDKIQVVDNNINNLSKVAVTHTQGSSVGSSSTPVYINSSGQAVACSSISVNLINSTMISRFYVNGKRMYDRLAIKKKPTTLAILVSDQ